MPKRYGVNERDLAAAWVVERLFDGRLRSGDRLDRNVIAAELGVSRIPIQEMLVQLERDGIVRTEYHRGAFVERFDPDVVRETYELYGTINGIAAARAAELHDPDLVRDLRTVLGRMRKSADVDEFDATTWEFRRTVNRAVAGPRLRAMLTSFRGFMPTAFRTVLVAARPEIYRRYRAEFDAIRDGDPDTASSACIGRAYFEGEQIVRELVRRGIFEDDKRRRA